MTPAVSENNNFQYDNDFLRNLSCCIKADRCWFTVKAFNLNVSVFNPLSTKLIYVEKFLKLHHRLKDYLTINNVVIFILHASIYFLISFNLFLNKLKVLSGMIIKKLTKNYQS